MENYKNILKVKGYCLIPKVLDLSDTAKIKSEINRANNVVTYKDRNGNLRRIEKLYDKGETLLKLNQKILKILKDIYHEDFYIFKDKYNAKPANGEGFFAHYDGIFNWKDKNGNIRNGWYEYSSFFINALIALDPCDKENGTIELSKIHNLTFNELLNNTKRNGTPDLLPAVEKKCQFDVIDLDIGDLVLFNNKCPHRSAKNISFQSRMTLYYTYNISKDGDHYNTYFEDKKTSSNKNSKSLIGQI